MRIAKLIENRASSDIVSATVDTPMREAVALLATRRIGAIPVMKEGRVAGIFSERDVIYRLADEGEVCLSRPLGEVMTAPAITVDRETPCDGALALMTRRRIRHLPVLDDETLCGFISIGDLVKSRIDEVQTEAAAMRNYITSY
ncbi:CBS domain-containing protein [Qipengyuania sp. MTN3-11]|uniref:CBS domain-containing protein n=1 Tax=Qipengyuania sp. MTN3-11 TaxID=3056557 RepID=UPI0036F29B05